MQKPHTDSTSSNPAWRWSQSHLSCPTVSSLMSVSPVSWTWAQQRSGAAGQGGLASDGAAVQRGCRVPLRRRSGEVERSTCLSLNFAKVTSPAAPPSNRSPPSPSATSSSSPVLPASMLDSPATPSRKPSTPLVLQQHWQTIPFTNNYIGSLKAGDLLLNFVAAGRSEPPGRRPISKSDHRKQW